MRVSDLPKPFLVKQLNVSYSAFAHAKNLLIQDKMNFESIVRYVANAKGISLEESRKIVWECYVELKI